MLAVPLTLYALSRAQHGVDPVFGFRPLDSMVAEVWGTFIVGRTNDLFQPWWVVLPGVLMFAIGLMGGLLNKSRRLSTIVIVLYLFVPLLAFYAATFLRPLYTGPRHLTLVLPPLYLLMAYGLALLWSRWRVVGMAALAVMLIVMGWWLRVQFTDPAYVKDDMRSVACTIAAQAKPEDGVVVHDAITSFVFDYYYRRCGGVAPWKIIPTYPSLDVDVALRDFRSRSEACGAPVVRHRSAPVEWVRSRGVGCVGARSLAATRPSEISVDLARCCVSVVHGSFSDLRRAAGPC